MEIIVYTEKKDQVRERLVQMARRNEGDNHLILPPDLEILEKKIIRKGFRPAVAILRPLERNTLRALSYMKHLFYCTNIMLILPDDFENSISLAHRLRPRYLTFSTENLESVEAVFSKILSKEKMRWNAECFFN